MPTLLQRPPRIITPLILAVAGLVPAHAARAEARPATCTFSGSIGDSEAACRFTPLGAGSFSVTLPRSADGAAPGTLRLDIEGPGSGRVTIDQPGGKPGRDAGKVRRDLADAACWIGSDFRICARAPTDTGASSPRGIAVGEPAPGGATVPPPDAGGDAGAGAAPVRFVSRCHMDVCTWVEQSAPGEVGKGTDAVPGRLLQVSERLATREYPSGNYPATIPDDVPWGEAQVVQYFCSPVRPAINYNGEGWTVLPLPEVFGATEGVTNGYIHACEPSRVQDDVYAAAETLGYPAGGPDGVGRTYPDFTALTTR